MSPRMAIAGGRRLLSYLQICPLVGLRRALLATAPEDCEQVVGRKEPSKRRRKEKKLKQRYSSLGQDSSWEERLANVATPLWRLPYEEQLKMKFENMKTILQALASRLEDFGADRSKIAQLPDRICCPLKSVVPSPTVDGYRNKSTFSVNRGPDGHPKTVGLYVGTCKGGDIVCVPASHLLNMTPAQNLVAQEELNTQKELLKDFFIHGPGAVCGLTSLYFQESTMTRCSHQQSPFQLLHGEPHIFEDLMGLKFRISPDAFFQVNTAGAEALYQTVGELSSADSDTVLLDVCCGTGAIGLSLAGRVSKVIGIEMVDQAVEDARWNAAFNGISNCEFHCGKAEAILPQFLQTLPSSQPLTAVVNPSRAGLHHRVVRAIRNCEAVRTLVYVSCKPDGEAMRNFIECCCPPDTGKKLSGEAFTPALAVPVDLFPHTPHCELVLLFTR